MSEVTYYGAPVLEADPFGDEVLKDPYSFFEALREAGPVAWLSAHQIYAVGRYAEVDTVASDYKRFTSTAGIGLSDARLPGAWRPPGSITEVDPPDHTAIRRAFQKILSPLEIRRWKDEFEAHAERVVDRIIEMGDVDGVKDIAEEFVLDVFPRIIGIDAPRERLILAGELAFNQIGPDNDRLQRFLAKAAPFMEWYADALQRKSMLPGGFGEQIYKAEEAGEFPPGTAQFHIRSFFRAGTDTTVAGIGLTLKELARHPDQFAMLAADSKLTRNTFDEGLRFEAPAEVLFRLTVGEVELGGTSMQADKKVGFFIGAANRDPRKWDKPDVFNIQRKDSGAHRAFGSGAHLCLGQMIARQEADAILGSIARRVKSLELAGTPKYRLVNTLRTLDSLPLRVTGK